MTSYLIKNGDKLKILPFKEMNDLSHGETMAIAVASIDEQKRQLLEDAINGKPKIYYGRNVVEALEESISKMEEKIPGLREQATLLFTGSLTRN